MASPDNFEEATFTTVATCGFPYSIRLTNYVAELGICYLNTFRTLTNVIFFADGDDEAKAR
jgi:hypothetical protein